MRIVLEDLNLEAAEKRLVTEALYATGSIAEAAQVLGTTRQRVKSRIIKYRIEWPRGCVPADRPRAT